VRSAGEGGGGHASKAKSSFSSASHPTSENELRKVIRKTYSRLFFPHQVSDERLMEFTDASQGGLKPVPGTKVITITDHSGCMSTTLIPGIYPLGGNDFF
jgi:hypothetical protein